MTRAWAWYSAVLALTTLSLAPGASTAASDEDGLTWRRIKLPDHGGIELLALAAWSVEAQRFFLFQFPTIEIIPPVGKGFLVRITPSWGTPDKLHFNDPANVQKRIKLARQSRRMGDHSSHRHCRDQG
jgi:hypothetical protein